MEQLALGKLFLVLLLLMRVIVSAIYLVIHMAFLILVLDFSILLFNQARLLLPVVLMELSSHYIKVSALGADLLKVITMRQSHISVSEVEVWEWLVVYWVIDVTKGRLHLVVLWLFQLSSMQVHDIVVPGLMAGNFLIPQRSTMCL